MGYPDVAAGQSLTAGMLQAMQLQSVEQGTTQDVVSSTTLVDSNLVLPAAAGAIYSYRLLCAYTCLRYTGTAGGIKFAWTAPTNGSVVRFSIGIGNANSAGALDDQDSVNIRRPATTSLVNISSSALANGHSYHEGGVINGGDGGNVTLQFAQIATSASASTITPSARLEWLRVG